MRLLPMLCVVAAMPGLAFAQCPVGEDLRDGIYVTYDDGSYTHYSGEIGGTVDEMTYITDGSGDIYLVPTLSGLFATGYTNGPGGTLDDSTQEIVTYSADLTQYLPVAPGMQLSVTAVRRFTDGTSEEERYTVFAGPEKAWEVAGCSYAAMTVTHTFIETDGVSVLTQEYLPALGIGVYTGYSEMGGSPEKYRVLEISAWAPK